MIKSIFSLSFSSLLVAISSFVCVAMIARNSSIEVYGVFALSLSILMIISTFFNTLSWQGILKIGNFSPRVLRTCFIIDILGSIIGFSLYLASIEFLTVKLTSVEFESWQYFLAPILLFMPNGTTISILRKYSFFYQQSITDSISAVFRLVSIFLASYFTDSLMLIILLYSAADFIRWILYLYIVKSKLFANDIATLDTSIIQKIYKFSLWGVLNEIVHLPASQLDRILCASFLSVDVLGVYDIFKRMCTSATYLTNPLIQVVYPNFIEKLQKTSFKNTLKQMCRIISTLSLFLLIFYLLLFFTKDLWGRELFNLSSEFLAGEYKVLLALLCMSLLFTYSFVPIHPFYLSLGFAKTSFIFSFIGSTVYLSSLFFVSSSLSFYYMPLAILLADLTIVSLKLIHIRKI